jgi:signal transduction histidine kinase
VEQLRSWGLPFEAAAQVVAELAVNAVTHGRVPGRDVHLGMAVPAGGPLRIEVTDTRWDRVPVSPGWGLAIVGALAERWGVSQGPAPRKTVWPRWDRLAGIRDAVDRDPVRPVAKP